MVIVVDAVVAEDVDVGVVAVVLLKTGANLGTRSSCSAE